MRHQTLFVSSVQKELSDERRAVRDFVLGDPLLRRFFDVFLFEDQPATDRRADEIYLDKVDHCGLYIGLFGFEYGAEDSNGMSPTECEFDRATDMGKPRLIFIKGADDKGRHPKMSALIRKAGSQLIRRRFVGIADLTASIYASIVEYLEHNGNLRIGPFDATACTKATLDDLSEERLRWFLGTAKRERQFALEENTSMVQALEHLNLLDRNLPSHAAMLLFGKAPQRFLISSEVKCMHFHGTEVRKPIPSYQIYKGTVFDLVDQALDFVMSKVARSVGTREKGPQAPVEYELPKMAVAEAIVNAIAHRDYSSNASVQVMLFSDRLEVWNPGHLPPTLTPEKLRHPHPSIPRNPLIADPLFLAHYIEKAGSGTLDMIGLCREAKLPEPDFRQDGGQWVVTLRRPTPQVTPQDTGQGGTKLALSRHQENIPKAHDEAYEAHDEAHQPISLSERQILEFCLASPQRTNEILAGLGYSVRTGNFKRGMKRLIALNMLEMTKPDKPRSKEQEYRLTEKGRSWLKGACK